MQAGIRDDGFVWVERGVCAGAGFGVEPSRGVGVADGPSREHDLPLQGRRDERWWDEQRFRPDVQNASQLTAGRNESGVSGHADLGDVEREREPEWLRS